MSGTIRFTLICPPHWSKRRGSELRPQRQRGSSHDRVEKKATARNPMEPRLRNDADTPRHGNANVKADGHAECVAGLWRLSSVRPVDPRRRKGDSDLIGHSHEMVLMNDAEPRDGLGLDSMRLRRVEMKQAGEHIVSILVFVEGRKRVMKLLHRYESRGNADLRGNADAR